MEYRKLPRGEEKISVLGVGTSSIGMAEEKEIEAAISLALENGINYFDMASADAKPFPAFGRALSGKREDAVVSAPISVCSRVSAFSRYDETFR